MNHSSQPNRFMTPPTTSDIDPNHNMDHVITSSLSSPSNNMILPPLEANTTTATTFADPKRPPAQHLLQQQSHTAGIGATNTRTDTSRRNDFKVLSPKTTSHPGRTLLSVQDITRKVPPYESHVETQIFTSILHQQQQQSEHQHHQKYRSSSSTTNPTSTTFHCIPDASLQYYIGTTNTMKNFDSYPDSNGKNHPHRLQDHYLDPPLSPTRTTTSNIHLSNVPPTTQQPPRPESIQRRVQSDTYYHTKTPLRSNRTILESHQKDNSTMRHSNTNQHQYPYLYNHHPSSVSHQQQRQHYRHHKRTNSSVSSTLAVMAQQLDEFQSPGTEGNSAMGRYNTTAASHGTIIPYHSRDRINNTPIVSHPHYHHWNASSPSSPQPPLNHNHHHRQDGYDSPTSITTAAQPLPVPLNITTTPIPTKVAGKKHIPNNNNQKKDPKDMVVIVSSLSRYEKRYDRPNDDIEYGTNNINNTDIASTTLSSLSPSSTAVVGGEEGDGLFVIDDENDAMNANRHEPERVPPPPQQHRRLQFLKEKCTEWYYRAQSTITKKKQSEEPQQIPNSSGVNMPMMNNDNHTETPMTTATTVAPATEPPLSISLMARFFSLLWCDFQMFVYQRRHLYLLYIRYLLMVVIPAFVISFILFYIAGNPPTGKIDGTNRLVDKNDNNDGDLIQPYRASASWWLLFLFVRQAFTFSLAQIVQIVVVDFLCLNTQLFINVFGRFISLFLTGWKGWPFIAFVWGAINFVFLYGDTNFAQHWLYYQKIFYIFTEANPSGSVTYGVWYTRILSIGVCVGLTVGVKRLWLGIYLGKKTYANHYEDLFKVYKKILTLCAVGELSRQSLAPSRRALLSVPYSPHGINKENLEEVLQHNDIIDEVTLSGKSTSRQPGAPTDYNGLILDPKDNDPDMEELNELEKTKMIEMFGAWEEPMTEVDDSASIRNVLEFRNALAKLEKPYMFGMSWGDVSTRQKMVLNSQSVYWKLKRMSTDPNGLKFDVLATICEQPDGTLHPDELKNLIRLLRPDREGLLSVADFVKSVDSVYKEAKLVHASVKNSEKIDREFEKALNIPFYTIVICIILSQIGLNPLTLFISLSPLILGFSWMIGSASSKMFEGWLFILIRRPYNIGDRIHISNVDSETNWDGCASWIVQDVTLFHTIAIFGITGERASMSNGSLASSRVLNMARSPNAMVYVYVKFATTVSYPTIQVFERMLREFVQSRPREWANFAGFRATRVVADSGFIEYVVHLIHRESWQSALSIYESKAVVTSFSLELSKKLDMRYESPSLPVDLTLVNSAKTSNNKGRHQQDAPPLSQMFAEIPSATNSLNDAQTDGHDDRDGSGSNVSGKTEQTIAGASPNQKPKAQQQQQQLPECFDESVAFQELVDMYSNQSNTEDNRSSSSKNNSKVTKEKEN